MIDVGRDIAARLAEIGPDVAVNALHGKVGGKDLKQDSRGEVDRRRRRFTLQGLRSDGGRGYAKHRRETGHSVPAQEFHGSDGRLEYTARPCPNSQKSKSSAEGSLR